MKNLTDFLNFKTLAFAFLIITLFSSSFARAQSPVAQEKPTIKEFLAAIDRKDTAEFKRMLAAGVNLEETFGDSKVTALHQAAAMGTPEMVKILIGKINIDERDNNNRTPLFYAATRDNVENVKILIKAGADMKEKDSNGALFNNYTENAAINALAVSAVADTEKFWQAFLANDMKTAFALLANSNAVANSTREKMTPLMYAVKKADAPLFEKLVAAGADVSFFIRDYFPPHRTVLDFAAEEGNIIFVRKILTYDLGRQRTRKLSHALSAAARKNHTALVPVLLEAGADVNDGFDFSTPVSAAAGTGNTALLKQFLANGANKKAISEALSASFNAPNSGEILQILLDAGADVNENIAGFSALTMAAEKGKVDVLQILIKRGADQQSIQNAFVVAAGKSQLGVMRYLLALPANKPDLNAKMNLGDTALIAAVENGHFPIVRYLAAKGADVNRESIGMSYTTPLYSAIRRENVSMVSMLLGLGAKMPPEEKPSSDDDAVVASLRGSLKAPPRQAKTNAEIAKLLQTQFSSQQIAANQEFNRRLVSAWDFEADGKNAEAVAAYDKVLEMSPTATGPLHDKISLLIQLKRFEDAVTAAAKMIETCQTAQCLPEKVASAFNYKAVAMIRLQKFADALPDVNKAIEMCTANKECNFLGSAFNNRGVINRETKKYAEAVADLSKAIELMPSAARPYFHRAKTFQLMGETQKAAADLARAKQLDPKDAEIAMMQITSAGK